MTQPQPLPFDPDDTVGALATMLRNAIADAVNTATNEPAFRAASNDDQVQAILAGTMVGATGSIVALMKPGSEIELRAALAENLPYWFDRALECLGREPIGEAN